jgi:HipA-like protein
VSREAGEELDVYLSDEHVGVIERRGPKLYRFKYGDEVLARRSAGEIVLSASLPIQEEEFAPAESRPFFDGLLPEGAVRSSLAHSLEASEEDGFALLEALGADCAGAVVVLPKGERPRAGEGEIRPLSEGDLTQLIEELPEHPLGIDGRASGVRLSLGGIQEKLILVRSPSGGYGQPLGGAPSTCILKPEHEKYPIWWPTRRSGFASQAQPASTRPGSSRSRSAVGLASTWSASTGPSLPAGGSPASIRRTCARRSGSSPWTSTRHPADRRSRRSSDCCERRDRGERRRTSSS